MEGRGLFGGKREGRPFNLPHSRLRLAKYILALALFGLVLMIISPTGHTPQPMPTTPISPEINVSMAGGLGRQIWGGYLEELERRLTSVLGQIQGVGSLQVFVTLESSGRSVYAQDVTEDVRTTLEQDQSGGTREINEMRRTTTLVQLRNDESRKEEPLLLEEFRPTIRGVVIVAEGAGDPQVALMLTQAVQTALDIGAHKIGVYPKR